jgi:hypothetical protein
MKNLAGQREIKGRSQERESERVESRELKTGATT